MKNPDVLEFNSRAREESAAAGLYFRKLVLAEQMFSSAEIKVLSGEKASELRAARKLFGVWDGREFRHPKFQYHTNRLEPAMAEILPLLTIGSDADANGWGDALWFYAPHALLEGCTPAEIFAENPATVVIAACAEFGHRDSDW